MHAERSSPSTTHGRVVRVGVKGGIAPTIAIRPTLRGFILFLVDFVMLAFAPRWKDRKAIAMKGDNAELNVRVPSMLPTYKRFK